MTLVMGIDRAGVSDISVGDAATGDERVTATMASNRMKRGAMS